MGTDHDRSQQEDGAEQLLEESTSRRESKARVAVAAARVAAVSAELNRRLAAEHSR